MNFKQLKEKLQAKGKNDEQAAVFLTVAGMVGVCVIVGAFGLAVIVAGIGLFWVSAVYAIEARKVRGKAVS